MRQWLTILALFHALPALARPAKPVERTDLTASFTKLACSGVIGGTPLEAWREGIFDSQVEGRILRRADGLPAELSEAKKKAKMMTRVLRYRGYVVGSCPDKSAFAAVTPSAKPISVSGET